jgi:hypothetical protein
MSVSEQAGTEGELIGEPRELAEAQFRLALTLCGACRDYHALWPFRRLAGVVSGLEPDAVVIAPALRAFTPQHGRLLIAGAADAGMLALALSATEGLAPFIEIVDRCPTPLAICRVYAKRHGITIETRETDLAKLDPLERYDVIFTHGFVQFIPATMRIGFLGRLAGLLKPSGSLIVAERLRIASGHEPRQGSYTDEMLTALCSDGVPFPEAEAAFRRRIEDEVAALRTRAAGAFGPKDLTAALTAAGYAIRQCTDLERRRVATVKNDGFQRVTMQIAVATPAA